MGKQTAISPLPRSPTLRHRQGYHVHTILDSFGAMLADYTFFPGTQVLYVRWHGHVTSDELVRAAHVGLQLNEQWQPRGLFQDIRGSSGEWGEAASWLEYEWIPGIKAKCPNLRSIACLLNADTPMPYSNAQLLAQVDQQFDFRTFYSLTSAWRWLDHRTRHQS